MKRVRNVTDAEKEQGMSVIDDRGDLVGSTVRLYEAQWERLERLAKAYKKKNRNDVVIDVIEAGLRVAEDEAIEKKRIAPADLKK